MDREYILKTAKKRMLKKGQHEPFVYVQTEDQGYCLPVLDTRRWNTDNSGRAKVLFCMGRSFAQEESITPEMIHTLYFVQEMWFVIRPIEEKAKALKLTPSQEPDRQECLGVVELSIDHAKHEMQQNFFRSDIIRYGSMIDLGPSETMEEAQSNLLTSFLAGLASAKYSDSEFEKIIDRFVDVGEI